MGARIVLGMTAMVLAIAPATALGCTIPIRTIGPLDVSPRQLVHPREVRMARAGWRLGPSWRSVTPRLEQDVRTRRYGVRHGVTVSSQRVLSIDAATPDRHGRRFVDDDDPLTPACEIAGERLWQDPVILVRETRRHVTVLAVTRATPGSRIGCEVEHAVEGWACPQLTRRLLRLRSRLGARTIRFASLQDGELDPLEAMGQPAGRGSWT